MRTVVRHLLTLGLGFAVVALVAATADAQGILTTKHNLSSMTTGNNVTSNTTEVCVFCHTPHGADTAVKAPLWNRKINSISSYTLYTSARSSTLDANVTSVDAGLGVSQACLSCHDGTIAFNALRNMPGSGNSTVPTMSKADMTAVGGVVNLTTDISNDHPIAIAYADSTGALQPRSPSSANENEVAGFTNATQNPAGMGTLPGSNRWWVRRVVPNAAEDGVSTSTITLPLYNNDGYWRVQCGTCHDPHRANGATINGSTQELFLRSVNNHYSKLCRTCHLKDVNG